MMIIMIMSSPVLLCYQSVIEKESDDDADDNVLVLTGRKIKNRIFLGSSKRTRGDFGPILFKAI